jgi:hypothetical protein
MDHLIVDLKNLNNICLGCGAVEKFAGSGLSYELLGEMDAFRAKHDGCLAKAADAQRAATVRVDGESFDMGGTHHSGEDERDTTDLAIRTALNGAL